MKFFINFFFTYILTIITISLIIHLGASFTEWGFDTSTWGKNKLTEFLCFFIILSIVISLFWTIYLVYKDYKKEIDNTNYK